MILNAVLGLGGLGLLMAVVLAFAYKKLVVRLEKKEELVRAILPGLNCGVCGSASCDIYASRLTNGQVKPNLCLVGGEEVNEKLSEALGVAIEPMAAKIAAIRCKGGRNEAVERYDYDGPKDCRSNYILLGGNKACVYGCLGLGHCVGVCPYKAITMGQDRLPIINTKKCTGCGICAKECPRGVIELIPKAQLVYLACKTLDKGKSVKEVCKKGCITCTICVKVCPYEGAISMEPGLQGAVGNLPVIHYEKCTSCGICYAKCPTDSFIDRAKVRPYAIIASTCNGCGECVKVCLFDAIIGRPDKRHTVIIERCIGCGRCFEVCPIKVITIAGALGYSKVI